MGTTVLVTGATSILDRELVTVLSRQGHAVLVHGRDIRRTKKNTGEYFEGNAASS
jgi:NAD(P)-dependent dehydrogenase (short-subunit alcohol dehydrogenase family)